MRVSLEEKEMRVFAIALALTLTLTLFQYPERDLNPHSRNGHRILSPACLPFHHPGGIFFIYLKKQVLCVGPCPALTGIPPSGRNTFHLSQKTSPVCRTLSRLNGNSTIRAEYFSFISKNKSCVSDLVPP